MSCMLRASGEYFNVDLFLQECDIEPAKIWRKGELIFPNSPPDGRRSHSSGLNFCVSNADFLDLEQQFTDAIDWFKAFQDDILKLVKFAGVERVVADFGAEIHPPGWCSFTFSPELQVLVGSLGVHLMLSVYPVDDEESSDE
jgi:hypothetical protein